MYLETQWLKNRDSGYCMPGPKLGAGNTPGSWLIWKDPDAGKIWWQEAKGMTEEEMFGWHHGLAGHEFEQILGDRGGQGSLVCYSPWGHRVGHDWATEQQVSISLVLCSSVQYMDEHHLGACYTCRLLGPTGLESALEIPQWFWCMLQIEKLWPSQHPCS